METGVKSGRLVGRCMYIIYERWRRRLQEREESKSKSKTLRESPLIVVMAGWALLFG